MEGVRFIQHQRYLTGLPYSVNGMQKVEGLDFRVEPPGIQLCRVGPPGIEQSRSSEPFLQAVASGVESWVKGYSC